MVNWKLSDNRRIFKEALIDRYRRPEKLIQFVDEYFDRSYSSEIGGDSLSVLASNLIEVVDSKQEMGKLYRAFCKENEGPVKEGLCNKLQCSGLVNSKSLPKIDITRLFEELNENDYNEVLNAFYLAFRSAFSQRFQYFDDNENIALQTLKQVQAQLERYGINVSVHFAHHIIDKLQAKQEKRDLSVLREWRDHTAEKHGISLPTSGVKDPPGYLLVSLKDTAKSVDGIAEVTIYGELFITGYQEPVDFGSTPMTCSIEQVADHLPDLIRQARSTLYRYGNGPITLELFLPLDYVDLDVGSWSMPFGRRQKRPLWEDNYFIVRSFDRANHPMYPKLKKEVYRKWEFLTAHLENPYERPFHEQREHTRDLYGQLKHSPGVKLLAELPKDLEARLDILDELIESSVPIALWFSSTEGIGEDEESILAEKLAEFDKLLQECPLTDFRKLAIRWYKRRREPHNENAIPHLRLLCDHPERWPKKPFHTDPIKAPSQSSA